MLIVRRNPEAVLDVLLPPFDVVARLAHPLTAPLVRLLVDGRARARLRPQEQAEEARARPRTPTSKRARSRASSRARSAQLLQSIVDFGDTLVREVMTPRPDIVAIRADATLGELRALFREQEYSRIPVYKENLDNILGSSFVKDLVALTEPTLDEPVRSRRSCGRRPSCPRPSACRSC